MLAYFPKPYSDELLYSLIARYSVHTGQVDNHKNVVQDVFGKRTAVAIPDLPSRLATFSHRVSSVWQVSVPDLIAQHTLANFYLPFLSEIQAAKIIASMKSDFGGNIHTRVGIAASSIQPSQYFQYCPVCAMEQQHNLGEAYWQRQHQLPCIDVCLRHNCKLIVSLIPFYSMQKHHFQAAETVSKSTQIGSVSLNKREHKLITMCQDLLEAKHIGGCLLNQWTMFYRTLAADSNNMKGNLVDHASFYNRLSNDWLGTHFAKYLPENGGNSWLIQMFRKHRKSFHPIRHLMVWCSFLPDQSLSDILTIVSTFPVKCESKCNRVFEAGQTTNKDVGKQRDAWLQLRAQYPEWGIKALRQCQTGGGLYSWLTRHDKRWLHDNSPIAKRSNLKRYQVNYAQWDENNLVLLNQHSAKLATLKKRPRASKTYLIKQLPRANSVEKHLAELPKTAKWLKLNQEDEVAYRKFRLRIAQKLLEESNLPLQRWRLLRLASIRKEYISQDIEMYIDRLLETDVAAA